MLGVSYGLWINLFCVWMLHSITSFLRGLLGIQSTNRQDSEAILPAAATGWELSAELWHAFWSLHLCIDVLHFGCIIATDTSEAAVCKACCRVNCIARGSTAAHALESRSAW